jgi:ABC-2 type transport system permease protein
MNKVFRIARHEFRATAANKAFVVITLLGPLLILAVAVLPGLLASSGASSAGSVVALSGGQELAAPLSAALKSSGARLEVLPPGDAESIEGAARQGVLSGKYSAALLLGDDWVEAPSHRLLTKTGTDAILYATIERVVGETARSARAARSGVDQAVIQGIIKEPELNVMKLVPGKGEARPEERSADSEFVGILLTVLSFVMLLYMTVLLYGQLIGRSVLQEKTDKTVEIMLSSVSSRDLMAGKILGPGLAGLIQYAFWIVVALLGVKVLGPALHVGLPSVLTPLNLLWLIVFFVPAYFLYASIYAALGAGAEDEQHLAQLAWPVIIFLMIPMVLINMFVMSPDSAVSVIFSFFPLTSPIVMMIRILVSPPPLWQVAISYALLALTIWGAAALAGKVFRVGILMTGKRRKLGEILKWAKMA